MDFAKNILSKFGWQDGEGLGKDKQGITKPIKASLKFDQAGLGADASSEFNNHWWERVFNDAAQNVDVRQMENGKIKVDLKDKHNSVEVSTKSYSVKKLAESGSGVYSNNFLAADTAANNSFAVTKYKVLSDEELFKACGGRTAHKGARHGLKLSGKISRLEQQEAELLAKMQARLNATNACDAPEKTLKKEKKKPKNEVEDLETVKKCAEIEQSAENDTTLTKKKKKKRKDNPTPEEAQLIEDIPPVKSMKKKRIKEQADPLDEEPILPSKSKKRKSNKNQK